MRKKLLPKKFSSKVVVYAAFLLLPIVLVTAMLSRGNHVFIAPSNTALVASVQINSTRFTSSDITKPFLLNLIAEIGDERTYEEFKIAIENENLGMRHKLAHLFGEALYEKSGLSGIRVCDESFTYGCYHTFLGSAIIAEGLPVIGKLNEKCAETQQFLACQHGIGHGVMGYFGYAYEDFVKALDVCESIHVDDPIAGCRGGVFMEYNFQNMLGEAGRNRPLDPSNPHFPCSSLPNKFIVSCYYWQPHWWTTVLGGHPEKKYKEIGMLCNEVTDETARKNCFRGAGNVVGPLVDWKASEAKRLCETFPSEGIVWCLVGARGSFRDDPSLKEGREQLCEGLELQEREICLSK